MKGDYLVGESDMTLKLQGGIIHDQRIETVKVTDVSWPREGNLNPLSNPRNSKNRIDKFFTLLKRQETGNKKRR